MNMARLRAVLKGPAVASHPLQRRAKRLQEQLHHHLVQDQFVIELAGDDLQVRRQAGFQPSDELLGLEAMRLHGGNA